MARHLSQLFEQAVEREIEQLRIVPESAASMRPGGESTWSPKEELGHLIDSAANNHIRFVNASIGPEFRGLPYTQNAWVLAHRYQDMPWYDIVDFWFQYNSFLARFVAHIPETNLFNACYIGSADPVSLQFLVEDYLLHMQHHLDHLLGRERVTAYPAPLPGYKSL